MKAAAAHLGLRLLDLVRLHHAHLVGVRVRVRVRVGVRVRVRVRVRVTSSQLHSSLVARRKAKAAWWFSSTAWSLGARS